MSGDGPSPGPPPRHSGHGTRSTCLDRQLELADDLDGSTHGQPVQPEQPHFQGSRIDHCNGLQTSKSRRLDQSGRKLRDYTDFQIDPQLVEQQGGRGQFGPREGKQPFRCKQPVSTVDRIHECLGTAAEPCRTCRVLDANNSDEVLPRVLICKAFNYHNTLRKQVTEHARTCSRAHLLDMDEFVAGAQKVTGLETPVDGTAADMTLSASPSAVPSSPTVHIQQCGGMRDRGGCTR
jgi:hypothetical protein